MTIPFLSRAMDLVTRSARSSAETDPPIVECHIGPDEDAAVAAGRGFLRISGQLTQVEYDRIAVAAAEMADARLQAVGVFIDSGGGNLAGVDTAVKALVDLRTALDDQLFTLAEGHAASAAYALLACGGRGKVLATAGSSVGSIGTLTRLEDSSRLWKDGMMTTVHQITANQPLKNIGAPGVPITPEAIAFQTEQMEAATDVFHVLVAAARRMPLADLVRAAGKGGFYQSTVALDLGLVDGIADKISFLAMVNGETPNTPQEVFPMAEPASVPSAAPLATGDPAASTVAAAPAATPQVPTAPDPIIAGPPLARADNTIYRPVPVGKAERPAPPPAVPLRALPLPTDPMAAIEAQGEQIADLMAAMTQMSTAIATEAQTRATAATAAALAPVTARIEACIPRVTREAADQALAVAATLSGSGADPTPAAAMLEAAQAESGDLTAEVTFNDPKQGPMVADFDLTYFTSPAENGEAAISAETREMALRAAAVKASSPPGMAMEALNQLFMQDGGYAKLRGTS